MKKIFSGPRLFALTLWMAFIGLSSCYKNTLENYGEEEIIIENTAIGVGEADDALEVAYYAQAIQKTINGGRVAALSCGRITDDPFKRVIVIDFGATPCVGLFSRSRQGKIIVNYSTHLADTLSEKTVTFSEYYVNSKKVEGTVILQPTSSNADTIAATLTLNNLKVEFVNGTTITFNGTQNRTWISGLGDSIITNNVYRTRGSMSGVSSSGHTFVQDITTPVISNFYCASQGYFARSYGVVELSQLQGYPSRKRTVDYGTGACDNILSVTTFRRAYGLNAN